MRDFLPTILVQRRFVENKVRQCFNIYGYEEIETPTLESFELIAAKAGDEIRHRIYSFEDLGGRKVALRPEMTPSIARIVATKLRTAVKPLRLGYIANCFRYDNPQMGRYREFWQAGFELFGSSRAVADAEIISINDDLMRRLGFKNFFIKIGSVAILREVLSNESLNEAVQNTMMGLIDKQRKTQVLDYLTKLKVSDDCLTIIKQLFNLKGTNCEEILFQGRKILHGYERALYAINKLEKIINLTKAGGVKTDFYLDLGFARGLEYYTGIIFEVFIPDLDIALGGGGRYDDLVELFGGEPTPAVGCSPGIDRIVLALEKKGLFQETETASKILVIPVNDKLLDKALEIASNLRKWGFIVHNEVVGKKVGSALAYANKKGYTHAVIVAPKELERNSVILRYLKAKNQKEVTLSSLSNEIKLN